MASELLGKRGVFWSQLAAEIEAFQLNFVTTTYEKGGVAVGKAECWTLVLTMVLVIWKGLRNVRLEVETSYVSKNPLEMVEKCFWVTLQAHRVVDDFL